MAITRFTEQAPQFYDPFFNDDLFDWMTSNFFGTDITLPAVNIKQGPDAFTVEVAAPGYKKDDFKIKMEDDVLTIASEKEPKEELKEGERYTKREFNYGAFTRSFVLPDIVEGDHISASYEDGLLRITLPIKEEAKQKPARMIEIQ
ncbi:MAG TPA: Hsp20/alpha crystallin family protein [Paludibacteraceae bacterium]|nr:Hsp20/alpha crystallin family protein [Paludibacteraceae bacterium]